MFQDYVSRPVVGFLWPLLFIGVFCSRGGSKGGFLPPVSQPRRNAGSGLRGQKTFLVQESGAAEASEDPAHSYYAQYQSGPEQGTHYQ